MFERRFLVGLGGARRRGALARHIAKLGQQRAEALILEEGAQRRGRYALQCELFERLGQRRIAFERDEPARQARHLGMLDQRLAQLGLGDGLGRGEHALQIAKLLDELRGGLGADAGNAGDVVDAVAHQRQHVAKLVRPHAEFF